MWYNIGYSELHYLIILKTISNFSIFNLIIVARKGVSNHKTKPLLRVVEMSAILKKTDRAYFWIFLFEYIRTCVVLRSGRYIRRSFKYLNFFNGFQSWTVRSSWPLKWRFQRFIFTKTYCSGGRHYLHCLKFMQHGQNMPTKKLVEILIMSCLLGKR